MKSCLGIDPATQLGWCFMTTGGDRSLGTVDLSEAGNSHQSRYCAAMRWINKVIKEQKPDLIAIEAPFIGQSNATVFLFGLRGALLGAMQMSGHRKLITPTPSQIDKHFYGYAERTRKARKNAIFKRSRALGANPKTQDEADAHAVADLGLSTLSRSYSVSTTPLFGASNGS